jgi:3-dehydro-L-gulonate 2-dehydrogenase
VIVHYQTLADTLTGGLEHVGLAAERARRCAHINADSTRDGVPSHGLNLFPRLRRASVR